LRVEIAIASTIWKDYTYIMRLLTMNVQEQLKTYVPYAHILPLLNLLFYYKICIVKVGQG